MRQVEHYQGRYRYVKYMVRTVKYIVTPLQE